MRVQPVRLQYYGEETGWGEGDRFVEKGNWGMYFMYDPGSECVWPTMAVDGFGSGDYPEESGKVLEIGFTAYQASNGDYSGVGSYSYTGNGHIFDVIVSGACIDEVGQHATVWGTATSNQQGAGYGFLTLNGKINPDGLMFGRAGFRTNETDLAPFIAEQCSGSPLFPADRLYGFMTFG